MQSSQGSGGGGGGDDGGSAHVVAQALKVGGSLIKGIGGYEAGKFQGKVDRFNKTNMLSDNVAQQQQVRDQARAVMGEQVAQGGASGLELGTGTALDVLHESAVNAQLDAMNLRRKSNLQGISYDNQAFSAKAQGTQAFEGGLIDAGITMFTGGADYAAAGS